MKQRKDLERHEKLKWQNVSDTGDKKLKCPSEGWLVFFEKNMNKIVNLVQKTWKKKKMNKTERKDSLTRYKINMIQNQQIQAQQSQVIQALLQTQTQILALKVTSATKR